MLCSQQSSPGECVFCKMDFLGKCSFQKRGNGQGVVSYFAYVLLIEEVLHRSYRAIGQDSPVHDAVASFSYDVLLREALCRDLELPQGVPPPPPDVTLSIRRRRVTPATTRHAVALCALLALRSPSRLGVIISQPALLSLLLLVQIHNPDLDVALHSVLDRIPNSDLGDLLGDKRYRAGCALHQHLPLLRAPVAANTAEAGHE